MVFVKNVLIIFIGNLFKEELIMNVLLSMINVRLGIIKQDNVLHAFMDIL